MLRVVFGGGVVSGLLPAGCPDSPEGYGIDAELICFDSGPSPLWRVATYLVDTGAITGIVFYDTAGVVATPTGAAQSCGEGVATTASIIGPVGAGSCLDAVRVTQCEPVLIDSTTPVDVAVVGTVVVDGGVVIYADSAATVRARRANLVGVGTWSIAADVVGFTRSVSVRRRPGGATAGVTITDHNSVVTTLLVGESETWSTSGLEDSIVSLLVTGVALSDVIIVWTEVGP